VLRTAWAYLRLAAILATGLVLVVHTDLHCQPARLIDISVQPSASAARATFLLEGSAGTVVLEPRGTNGAQVRMRPIRASKTALQSGRLRNGVQSIAARIERRDVLVVDIRFNLEVASMAIVERRKGKVQVEIRLGAGVDITRPAGRPAKSRWALSTIVIDAGHGGKDPGALGLGGLREKDVTLAVATELARRVRAGMPGVTVVMTRTDDRFVELYRRGQLANERQGRLFLSIHCNSMPGMPHPASGFECYVLRPGRTDDAARVAATENEAIRYEMDRGRYEGDNERAIIAAMAQSAFARYSEEAAHRIRKGLRGATTIPDRGVHQAGFFVLVGASMPAVLIELGYLTNDRDAKVLASATGRKRLAGGIYNGVRAFERYYASTMR